MSKRPPKTKFVAKLTTKEGEKLSIRVGGREPNRWIVVFSNTGEENPYGSPALERRYCDGNDFELDDLPRIMDWLSRAPAASLPPCIEEFVEALENLLSCPGRYELMTEGQAFVFGWEDEEAPPLSDREPASGEATETQMDLLDWNPTQRQPGGRQ